MYCERGIPKPLCAVFEELKEAVETEAMRPAALLTAWAPRDGGLAWPVKASGAHELERNTDEG
jgi:hypothetical protein